MAMSKEQNEAWRSLVIMTHVLDDALDRQSQRDGGLPHAYYKVLIYLYESPGKRLTMTQLAAQQRHSTSRMTHAVSSMEASGWLRRTRAEHDKRVKYVELTDEGIALVRVVSPAQVTEVRERAFSRLDPVQVAQLSAISIALVEGLDGPRSGDALPDADGDGD